MNKTRVLLVNEYSQLNTGYSVYGNEVLRRLSAVGDYELAELACYFEWGQQPPELPWAILPNNPPDAERTPGNAFDALPTQAFGSWRFHEACLEFRPDIIFDIRDMWMTEFEARSPYRRFYRWAPLAPVDSVPQRESWLAHYVEADAVLTYTDWGADVLRRDGGGLVNVFAAAPAGIDFEVFRPMNRDAVRDAMGIDRDAVIVGTVMRNQPRKLFPALIRDFAEVLRRAPSDLARRLHLYLHTSWPDEGIDLPRFIRESGISRKIACTYVCAHCKHMAASFFQDAPIICPRCHQRSFMLPNVKCGVDRKGLAAVNNLFDVYVQYSNSEGLGIPQLEAAACGIPVMAVDYSAMSDVVRKLGGVPIDCRLEIEPSTGTYRASPVGEDFVVKLLGLLRETGHKFLGRRKAAAEAARRHYTWDRCAQVWDSAFRKLIPPGTGGGQQWSAPPRFLPEPPPVPERFDSHRELVRWGIQTYLGRPELSSGYMAMRAMRDLSLGMRRPTFGGTYQNEDSLVGNQTIFTGFGPKEFLQELDTMRAEWNRRESERIRATGPTR